MKFKNTFDKTPLFDNKKIYEKMEKEYELNKKNEPVETGETDLVELINSYSHDNDLLFKYDKWLKGDESQIKNDNKIIDGMQNDLQIDINTAYKQKENLKNTLLKKQQEEIKKQQATQKEEETKKENINNENNSKQSI